MPGFDLDVLDLTGPGDPALLDTIREIVADAEQYDGVAPVNEEFLLHVSDGAPGSRLALERGGAGFATATDGELVVVVRPGSRGQGLGRALTSAVMAAEPSREWSAWAHGDLPAAKGLLAGLGFAPQRVLLRMERELDGGGGFETGLRPSSTTEEGVSTGSTTGSARPSSTTEVPTGSTTEVPTGSTTVIRSFRVGEDEERLLAANAVAFAEHPEQGRLDLAGLRARMATPWFDPTGLLLAEKDGHLIGFHWTKMESPDLGEVYVLGLVPEARGQGLAGPLLSAGLEHLRSAGAKRVELYVDAENSAAVALYERRGFTVVARDVQYVPEFMRR